MLTHLDAASILNLARQQELPEWAAALKDVEPAALHFSGNAIRGAVGQITFSIEECTVDGSYLDFLGGQIRLEPRGAEWTQVLTARLKALTPFLNRPIVILHVLSSGHSFIMNISKADLRVIRVEEG